MLLKHWAAKQGISYRTALRWHKAGTLPVPTWQQAPGFSIMVKDDEPWEPNRVREAVGQNENKQTKAKDDKSK